MISRSIALLFAALLAPALAAGDTCSLAARFPALAKALHARKWTTTTPDDVQRIVAVPLKRADLSDPPCSGTVEMTSGDAASCLLTAAFVKRERGGRCVVSLDAVSFLADLPMSRAEGLRADVIGALKPGGRAEGDAQHADFFWRSADSRTRYNLFASVEPSTANPSPATPAAVKVILRHAAVDPDDVDDLPFEKGYFPPRCPKN
ncbi:MAG TPA: hypothetical protein VJZ76_12305 [Thermoanaerobaculia bacterium]|nr:hypothetical protein [Thermoanaerobaculia bacterium]